MVSVRVAGEWDLLILFKKINPLERIQNQKLRRDGGFYSKCVSAQQLCSISSTKLKYLCCTSSLLLIVLSKEFISIDICLSVLNYDSYD